MGRINRLFTHHLFCLLTIILFLFSCTSSNRLEGYVYYRLNANPTTLDPALITDVSSASIAAKLFNGLVKLNDNIEIAPDIAERWEISKDGLRYEFYLRKGVRFTNGREVKAQDFKYSFERILDPKTKSPNTWVFDKVEGAKEFQKGHAKEVKGFKVIDDYTFYEERGRLAAGPVPDLLRKWDVKAGINYDPQRAKEIIRREGMSGIKVNMYVTADQDVVDLAEIIQSYLSEIGINMNIKQLEWSAYKDAVNKGEPDMFWLSWWADYSDPENFLFPLFHSSNLGPAGNRTRYVNKEVDTLIEKGQNSLNEKERNNFYKKAEEIIIQDMPWVSFWHRTDFLIKQPWIKGYKVYPIYTMDKGTEVEIER
jgi:ABC-type transport system substrate-binding protein